jgi:hypothetical protein
MNEYLAAIKDKVCKHCIDADSDGNCRLASDKVCTIEANYDRIVRAVLSTHSDRYDDYIVALRSHVCENCNYGQPDDCDDRQEVECPLDRYYPLVIDAIEVVGIDNIRRYHQV